MNARSLLFGMSLALAGCGNRLVGGDFLGDATLRLHGVMQASVGEPLSATVGALWLGYSALSDRSRGVETTLLPISSIEFPPNFQCDILDPPPSAGQYTTAAGEVVPSSIRLARLVLFDDLDHDGHFSVDAEGRIAPPDRLLARSESHLLLYVQRPLADPAPFAGKILDDWRSAFPGYHLVKLDPSASPPDLRGQIVDSETPVVFSQPQSPVNF